MRKPSKENVIQALYWVASVAMILFVLFAVGMYSTNKAEEGGQYYSSEYSKYCYPKTIAQTRIKVRIYFKTLEECGKPLPKGVLPE